MALMDQPIAGKASLIILTYNNLDLTRQCLESIYAKTDEPEFEVILVDNASQDDTPQYLKGFAESHANVKLILNSSNEGFARGNNLGAAAATGQYLVFLNNDIVVTKGWLAGLIRHLKDSRVGMVGPVTNSSGNESQIVVDYQTIDGLDTFAENYTYAHSGQAFEIQMMPFQCVALRRTVFNEIGPLDEQFGIGMFEDDDLALRLRQSGYKILCVEDVFIHHWGSASFSKLSSDDYWELFKSNLRKFEDKWGVQWLPHAHRPELIPQQMRQYLDGAIYYTDTIARLSHDVEELQKGLSSRERELAERNQEIAGLTSRLAERNQEITNLSSRLVEAQQTIKWQTIQMNGIYESNGWAFLQMLLRFRRRVVPEGSRRERIFRSVIGSIRNLKWKRKERGLIITQPGTGQSDSAQPGDEAETSTTRASQEEFIPQPNLSGLLPLADRFPWPLVSVILPVYNHADMLEAAARSILDNTYPNIELIILDDGSTDQIEPVLMRLANHPRVCVYRQPNQKLPRALTHAHQFARGKFVTWISSDNRIAPSAINKLVEALLSHPEVALVYADVSLIGEDGLPLHDVTYRPQNQDIEHPDLIHLYRDARALGYEGDNYVNACFLYRREAAEALEGHYADDLRGLEDYDFWMRLQKAGQFYHLRNDDVLYYYRVHERTMSHDILSQERQRTAHVGRAERLIEYEARRRSYAQQRWTLVLDERLDLNVQVALSRVAQRLPVDYQVSREGWSIGQKRLRFISGESDIDDPIRVQVMPGVWKLDWKSGHTGVNRHIEIWKGIELSPLAFKAREYQGNRWEFQGAGQRPIVGFHYGLAAIPLDIQAIRQVIENNPSLFFVFVDVEGKSNPALGDEIVRGLENAAYMGVRPFGEAYQLYACFDALWLPPFDDDVPVDCYGELLALAYAIARPFIAPRGDYFTPAPYQFYYHPPDESLDFIRLFQRSTMDVDLLDSYLDTWTPYGCLGRLIRLADAVSQEMGPARPDFRLPPLPITPARRWARPPAINGQRLKCGVVVNSLGLGGLEALVAQVTQRLPGLGVDPFVICTTEGGQTAEALKAQGFTVYIANGDRKKMRAVLEKEKPHLLNSHLASLEFLQVADALGIPLVETIHSSYIWMEHEDWEREKRRSRYFSHAIATSHTTRRYYAKWNNAYPPENITIIPTGIDPERISTLDRGVARQKLGFSEEDYLFLSVASYDGVKNHMGILTAFEQVASRYPKTRLWFVGNISSPGYFQEIDAYRNTLKSKDRIEFQPHRQDVSVLLSAADTFVVNSFSEGWSLAATEALMAGVPLIHSECGSAYELVGEAGERGIVIPNPAVPPINIDKWVIQNNFLRKYHRNTEALVLAMQKMIEGNDHWRARGEQISRYASRAFSLENMLKCYLQVFHQVMGISSD